MFYELNTKLNYQIRYFQLYDYPDDPEINIGVQPDFDGYNKEGDECTVFDFLALAEKMHQNANYYPITCECGMPDDACINAPITQTVLDNKIYWDIPIADYRWTVSPKYAEKEGILRLIFDKQQFQQTVLQMNAELQSLVENGVELSTIHPDAFIKLYGGNAYFLEILQTMANERPQVTHANIDHLYPYGGMSATKVFIT